MISTSEGHVRSLGSKDDQFNVQPSSLLIIIIIIITIDLQLYVEDQGDNLWCVI